MPPRRTACWPTKVRRSDVVYVSTHLSEVQRSRLMARGAYRCLEKPIDAAELLDAIATPAYSMPAAAPPISMLMTAVPGVGIEPT